MALVTIVIQDGDEGEVDVKLFAEPAIPCKEGTGEPTPAQYLGAIALHAATKAAASTRVEAADLDGEDED